MRDDAIARIAELVKAIPVAMLTTVTETGHLHSRPMATQVTPLKGEILFLTGEHSGKVDEVRKEHEVTLTYTGSHTFVTVSGRGTISNDRALIRELWMPIFEARFPGGVDDPEIRVLHVEIDRAEYWETAPNSPIRSEKLLS